MHDRHSRCPGAADRGAADVGYNDVLDAWNYYLAHENHGRGVVLIGHSQGSGVLTRLIARRDRRQAGADAAGLGDPDGHRLAVPTGADVGGDFKSIPLCHSASQLGCVIAYSSFRDTSPPPANSRFGRPRDAPEPGMEAACVNPANLAGGSGEAKSYFAGRASSPSRRRPSPGEGQDDRHAVRRGPGPDHRDCVAHRRVQLSGGPHQRRPGRPARDDIPGDVWSAATCRRTGACT